MKRTTLSERALVLAPRGRDGPIAVGLLQEAGFEAAACPTLSSVIDELNLGAAFVVVTEEAITDADLAPLVAWLDDQQEWSDLPFILLTTKGGGLERNPSAGRYLDLLGNVTFLERPFHPTTLVSLARSALRGRRRQYQARASLRALRDSEGRFRAAVQAVQGMVWTNDADGRMVGEQPGWQTLTGQSRAEYEGYGWARAVHPEDAEPTVAAWNRAVEARSSFNFEHRVRCADGQWRHFAVRAVPVLDEADMVREWVGVHTDITKARTAEAALREETRTLETLNRIGAALAAELKLEPVVQTVTDAGVTLTGAEFGAFFYNVLDEAGQSYMLYTLSGAERSDFESFGMPRATAVFKPTFMGEGVIRAEDILLDERYGKNPPFNGMPEGHLPVRSYLAVPVTSRSGGVIGGLFFGHPQPGRFTDRHEQLLLGLAGQAAVAIDNARLYEALERSNETLEQRVADEVLRRVSAEDALRQAQKMEAIGQLTGGVAHDFNNLLTIIKGSTHFLRRADVPEERRRQYLEAISDTVDRASKLTGQLLAFARRSALKPEIFNAAEQLRVVADMLRTIVGARIAIITEFESSDCWVEADSGQFETALVNMAINGRDAMEEEGRLTIRVETAPSMPGSRAGEAVPGPFVAISLTDTGSGIAEERLPFIFEPFYTTKPVGKGTGLGLSQVYGFAKQSGGDVTVDSRPGAGARFTLYLPKVESPAHEKAIAVPKKMEPDRGSGRVLVVEDNPEVGAFSTQILRELGYETVWAASADEALNVLRKGARVDVVFTDVVMPGMSGVELGEAVRRLYPGLPVVLTSGYSHVLAEEGRHGFELLQKPYAVEDLSHVLHRIMTRGDAQRTQH